MAAPDYGQGTERESRPSPIDVHVGTRIRLRRTLLGMSQERLGEALGLTFQQVQKYERGVNRVGASRLFDLSRVLDVPISFFFDDMPDSLVSVYGGNPAGEWRALPRCRTASATTPSTGARRSSWCAPITASPIRLSARGCSSSSNPWARSSRRHGLPSLAVAAGRSLCRNPRNEALRVCRTHQGGNRG